MTRLIICPFRRGEVLTWTAYHAETRLWSWICRLSAGAAIRVVLAALDRQLDQAINQLGIAQTAGLPQLGIHARAGESRHGVELVEQHGAITVSHEEVDARQAGGI